MIQLYDYLPVFHTVENNNLKSLLAGQVIAQVPVNADSTLITQAGPTGKERKYFENGHLCALVPNDDSGVCMDIWEKGRPMYLSFTEPLNVLNNSDAFSDPKYYAVDLEEEFARFVLLTPGDEWTTDIDYFTDPLYAGIKAELEKVIVCMNGKTGTGADNWFGRETMPDDVTKGYHYVYLGGISAEADAGVGG